ncbi:opine dehydrogenase-like [Mizuhopecten yessoensis]|uniref:Opine dehydrogenase n=1 Tax=Mizuhopecten yessoensis TaxID=6573 RepID=A0A210PJ80_MIZYE|nr:opine dehydrogenase-like [Mizuhopecten yessoensis]OWF36547.1 Opine dehydrogenase [Mizuhopecten yessoensis]
MDGRKLSRHFSRAEDLDSEGTLKILVCGGGNGAHCMAALASCRPHVEVRVLTLYKDEAESWTKALEEDDMTISITYSENHTEDVKSRPSLVTKDPEKATDGIHMIFFTVPAFAHEQYLNAISKYVLDNTLLIGLPGQAGFEFQAVKALGTKAKQCAVASFESLPWACRIMEFGRHVQLLGFKESLGAAILIGSKSNLTAHSLDIIQFIFGENPVFKVINNYVAINLMAKSIIHPPLMYGRWRGYKGEVLQEKPLFYQGVDEEQAGLLSKVSDEVVNTAKVIQDKRKNIDMSAVIHILDWYREYYCHEISDHSCLMKAMQTNKAYDGLLHPMKPGGDDGKGFIPDFHYRYTREDVPFGLVVMKGIAEIAGVETPTIDTIITWAQKQLGKEFIVGNRLTGKDMNETRAPQVYGFETLDHLFHV